MTATDKRAGNGLMIGGSLVLAWMAVSYPLQSVQQTALMVALNSRDEKTLAVVGQCASVVNNWYRLPLAAIGLSLIAVGVARRIQKKPDDT